VEATTGFEPMNRGFADLGIRGPRDNTVIVHPAGMCPSTPAHARFCRPSCRPYGIGAPGRTPASSSNAASSTGTSTSWSTTSGPRLRRDRTTRPREPEAGRRTSYPGGSRSWVR